MIIPFVLVEMDIHGIVMVLENGLYKVLDWFTCNGIVVNSNKFQLMLLCLKWKQKKLIKTNGVKILAKKHAKLLGVEISSKLKFDRHVEALCQKVNKKTSAFARLTMYISREQALCQISIIVL